MRVAAVTEEELPELLPLVRGYCAFYESEPGDEALLALSRALLVDPVREGVQLLARDGKGQAVGFATVYWSWETKSGTRLGVMNDLFVATEARGTGVAEALIEACRKECRARGAKKLAWQTAPDNLRAQRVYERIGATKEEWLDYWLPA